MSKLEELASTVYVGGIPEEVTSVELKNIFITFGDVKSVEIPVDQNTSRPKGYAFIEFEEPEDAEAAIDNFDEAELFGKIVKVKPARSYKNKQLQNKAIWHSEEWQIEQHFTEKPVQRGKRYGSRGRKEGGRGGERDRSGKKDRGDNSQGRRGRGRGNKGDKND